MLPIKKQIVTDESMRPVAVIIDYNDWQKIEAILQRDSENSADIEAYAGTIRLTVDPLDYQRQERDRW